MRHDALEAKAVCRESVSDTSASHAAGSDDSSRLTEMVIRHLLKARRGGRALLSASDTLRTRMRLQGYRSASLVTCAMATTSMAANTASTR